MIKSNLYLKIFLIIKIFLIYLVFISKSYAGSNDLNKNLIVVGSDNAEVKIKIFSSLTCPHCANFHTNVVPKIRDKYVKSGKQFI